MTGEVHKGQAIYNNTTTVLIRPFQTISGNVYVVTSTNISTTVPFTWANNDIMKVRFTVPVVELSGSTSTYSSQCGANCVDVFSAYMADGAASGDISNENVNFINGNCTNPSAGVYVCSFNSGIFTVAPNCTATSAVTNHIVINTTTSSAISYTVKNDAGTLTDTNLFLSCQKQGADFTASRTIVGSFKNVVTTPAVTKPISFSFTFGGATKHTVCSSSPCTLYGNLGGIVTSVTRASAGRYTVNLSGLKTGSSYNCSHATTGFSGASSGYEANISGTTGVTSFTVATDSTLGVQDSANAFNCDGEIE